MANCLQLALSTSSIPYSSSFSSASSSSSQRRSLSRAPLSVVCKGRRFGGAKIPMPPLNPNDPFLQKIAHAAANPSDTLLRPGSNPETPPFLDLFSSPKLALSEVEFVSPDMRRPDDDPPPDLPSVMLDHRIVFIGMPLVSAVSELVIGELMYLNYMDPKVPIHIYINSSGTTRGDGQTVAMESEGFAIYDILMQLEMKVYTVNIGTAIGQACLLLAAGTKGKRFMLPSAQAMIQQPRVPSTGLMQASDVLIHAKEAIVNRDTLVELLALHTGNSVETVGNAMKRPFYMNAYEAQKFGVIDKIYWQGMDELEEIFMQRWEEEDDESD